MLSTDTSAPWALHKSKLQRKVPKHKGRVEVSANDFGPYKKYYGSIEKLLEICYNT